MRERESVMDEFSNKVLDKKRERERERESENERERKKCGHILNYT